MQFKKIFFLTCLLNVSVTVNAMVPWDHYNNPNIIASETPTKFEYNFQKLPLTGDLGYLPWVDSYWPSYKRGLAARYMEESKGRKMPPKNRVLRMSPEEIATLSPAEKYDLYLGDYSYSLTKSELNRTSPRDARWEGLCHGWAAASYLFQEPNSITLENADGVQIPFGSSDIKGLLSYMQGNSNTKEYIAGTRCEQDLTVVSFKDRDDACLDINAGAFHVILANRVGVLRRGFVIDADTGVQVWNHPVYAYSTKIIKTQRPSPKAAKGTVKELVVNTTIKYMVESTPSFEPIREYQNEFIVERNYDYVLEINDKGIIVGGEWISDDYPDFVWVQKKSSFEGFEPLEEIYNQAIQE